MAKNPLGGLAIAAALLSISGGTPASGPQGKFPDRENSAVVIRNAELPHAAYAPCGSSDPARSPYR